MELSILENGVNNKSFGILNNAFKSYIEIRKDLKKTEDKKNEIELNFNAISNSSKTIANYKILSNIEFCKKLIDGYDSAIKETESTCLEVKKVSNLTFGSTDAKLHNIYNTSELLFKLLILLKITMNKHRNKLQIILDDMTKY